jgi:hypothetical protein
MIKPLEKGCFHLQSRFKMAKEQMFAPPATSPFTILTIPFQHPAAHPLC